MTTLPNWPGWHLLGAFPDDQHDDVGSWLLHNNGEAMLLEVPPGLTAIIVNKALRRVDAVLKYVTASHDHEDHLDPGAWSRLKRVFQETDFVHPLGVFEYCFGHLGNEIFYLVKAPKHSNTDVVTIFRGVAMTGDIELGTLDSVNNEVSHQEKVVSMRWLGKFPGRVGYRVHSIVSAHLNDVRSDVVWEDLFTY